MENKGGCITCRKCEQVRINFYCGRKKLSQKQLYNTHGFCSNYEPKEQIEKSLTNEEWFCGLSTEGKVTALLDLRERIRIKMRGEIGSENKFYKGDYYREWLKEKHK